MRGHGVRFIHDFVREDDQVTQRSNEDAVDGTRLALRCNYASTLPLVADSVKPVAAGEGANACGSPVDPEEQRGRKERATHIYGLGIVSKMKIYHWSLQS